MFWDEFRLADLDCYWCDPRTDKSLPLKRAVILCHGFGAPGDDLTPLADALCRFAPELKTETVLVFPAAPLSLADQGMPDGRAWWPLNVMELQMAIAMKQERRLLDEIPPGLESARKLFAEFWQAVAEKTGLHPSQIVLGGFSQGAMLTTDVALHSQVAPAGVLTLSGTLLASKVWTPLMANRAELPVFIAHGEYDPVLPFSGATALQTAWMQHHAAVEFEKFPGGHEIPLVVLSKAARWLVNLPRPTSV